jgi:hypothetical protein
MAQTKEVIVCFVPDVHAAARAEACRRNLSFSAFVAGLIRQELALPVPDKDPHRSAYRYKRLERAAA